MYTTIGKAVVGAISVRLPDDLKDKAMKLAKKKNISFNSLVNYWLQAGARRLDAMIEALGQLHDRLRREV